VIETNVQNWLKEANEVIKNANKLQEDPSHAKVRVFHMANKL